MTPEKLKKFQEQAAAGSGVPGADGPATTGAMRPGETAPKNALALALQNPTLSDMLVRDLAAGQVRTMRKGGRRGTYSGTAQSPYSLPPLMG